MKKLGISAIAIIILVIIIGLLAYFLGKKSNSVVIENIATNTAIIKQISELSTLEARGNATIKSTNIKNDGTFSDNFKKMFNENTINITVPYIAKYGVSLDKQEIQIEENNNRIIISLPQPQLLSYEIQTNKISHSATRGVFQPENVEYFSKVEQKLYEESRSQLAANQTYIDQSKEKIVKVLQDYYAPTGYTVEIYFAEEKYNLQNAAAK